MRRGCLIVMLKAPVAGRVKTRLGQEIGMVPAAWWFRHQVRRLLRRIEDPRWDVILAISPDNQVVSGRFWSARFARIPQGRGDLGNRMARAMASAPRQPVCVIGGDVPGITRLQIARAFGTLGSAEAVFGPAEDGGYWLVGLKRGGLARRTMFEGVRWSTRCALADSRAALVGWRITEADHLRDVDGVDDLAALARDE